MGDAFKVDRELDSIQKNTYSLEELLQISPQTADQEMHLGSLINRRVEDLDKQHSSVLINRAKQLSLEKHPDSGKVKDILNEISAFEDEVALPAKERCELEAAKDSLRGAKELLSSKECCSYSDRIQNELALDPNIHLGLEKAERADMAFYLYEMAGVLLIQGDKLQFFSLYRDLPVKIRDTFNLLIHNMGACLDEFTVTLDLTRAYTISRQLAEAAVRTGYFVCNGYDLGASAKEEVDRIERELSEYMPSQQPEGGDSLIQAKFA